MNRLCALFVLLFVFTHHASTQTIQPPDDFLGHQVGADFKLARWESIVEYFKIIGQNSDRVVVEELDRTTEDAPYIMATISSPDTIQNLERYKQLQRKISHPNEIADGERQKILREAKPVIVVSCSLHSNEIAASQMSMELLYELASKDDDSTKEILENCIILLVPSANPDGINKVIDWYEKSLDTPWEGRGMPWLYQKYVGHDNNRDWFMVTQKETQILTRVLYEEWYPTIIYDVHQMGNNGTRFFVPPFFDPISPNVDPIIHESLKIIGGHMATALAEEGKTGVISNAIYDNWWNGGNRTTPYRHNIVGILTEAASPNIASPIFQRKSELSGHLRGLPKYAPQVNFADPWDGGWWRLRDVVEYEKTACFSLFSLAARYRDMFNRNYLTMGEKAIRLGKEEPPYAFLIPPSQRDFPTAIRLLRILQTGGVDVSVATKAFQADGVKYPEGTYIIFAAQPYRNFIRDMLEPQDYPDRFLYPGGPAEPPYDVAGWTLSFQMGVNVIPAVRSFDVETRTVDHVTVPNGSVHGGGSHYVSKNQSTNDFILLNRALRKGIKIHTLTKKWKAYKPGALIFSPDTSSQKKALQNWIQELGLNLERSSQSPSSDAQKVLQKNRTGLYYPWQASMDEGWTRFVLEQFEFEYHSLYNADIRAGDLKSRYDVIILPDVGTRTIMKGMAESTTEPEYAGGIGDLGVTHLQEFVKEGGRLLCLDSSSMFAVQYFDLPVKNALSGLKQNEFFCPGSILRVNFKPEQPLTYGMENPAPVYFARSYAFDIVKRKNYAASLGTKIGKPEFLAAYDNTVTLLSGWILGEEKIQGKGAVVQVPYGKGEIILYGFRVQHRGQTHGTFRILFNGITAPRG